MLKFNDRIEQFDKQATTVIEGWSDERGTTRYYQFSKEKFAELVVKECIQFIEEENVRLCEYQNSLPEWDGNKRDDCDLVIEKCIDLAERMKEHFGVDQ